MSKPWGRLCHIFVAFSENLNFYASLVQRHLVSKQVQKTEITTFFKLSHKKQLGNFFSAVITSIESLAVLYDAWNFKMHKKNNNCLPLC